MYNWTIIYYQYNNNVKSCTNVKCKQIVTSHSIVLKLVIRHTAEVVDKK